MLASILSWHEFELLFPYAIICFTFPAFCETRSETRLYICHLQQQQQQQHLFPPTCTASYRIQSRSSTALEMAGAVDQKLLKATKFPPEFSQRVDMKAVNVEVLKK